jgi:hypothetical protein
MYKYEKKLNLELDFPKLLINNKDNFSKVITENLDYSKIKDNIDNNECETEKEIIYIRKKQLPIPKIISKDLSYFENITIDKY